MKQKIEQYSYQARKAKQRKILSILFLFIFIFVSANLVNNYLLFSVKQSSISMSPDVPEKSIIMVTPICPRIDRGDVILLNPKADYKEQMNFFDKCWEIIYSFFTFKQISTVNINKFPCSQYNLRRVVCVPGDTFYMRDYVLYVKPKGEKHFLTEFELTDKKYNVVFSAVPSNWDSEIGVKGYFNEITLNDGEYFVLGDNRKSCDDSRLFGAITKDDIRGKALICYFPFTNLKLY